jgi:hypothetical protein
MEEEFARHGIQLPKEDDIDEELFEFWRQRQQSRNKKDKVMLNRFLNTVYRMEKELPFWSMDTIESQFIALQCNMCSSKKFASILQAKFKDAGDVDAGGKTGGKVLHFDDKSLKQSGYNAMQIRTAMLSDYNNYRACIVLTKGSRNLKEWRANVNHKCRSPEGSRTCLTELVNGGAYQHCCMGLNDLSDPRALRAMLFKIPKTAADADRIDAAEEAMEEEFADLAFTFIVSLFGERLGRLLYLFAWPHRFHGIADPAARPNIMEDFRRDLAQFRQLERVKDPVFEQTTLLQRHVFQMVTNRQIIHGVEELEPTAEVTPELVHIMHERAPTVVVTTANEEIIGCVKNLKQSRAANRYRRPEVCMARALGSTFLQDRFSYDHVDFDTRNTSQHDRLDKESFCPAEETWSMAWKEIQGPSQTVPWYSPSATNVTVNCADLFHLRFLNAAGSTSVSLGNIGAIFALKHSFVFACKMPDKSRKWCFPIKYFPGSAVLALPVTQYKLGEGKSVYKLAVGKEPFFFSLTELTLEDRGRTVRPVSVAWLRKNVAAFKDDDSIGIMLLCTSTSEPIVHIMVKHGCWMMCKTIIREILKHFAIVVRSGADLLETLIVAGVGFLKCTEAQAMDYCHHRIVNMRGGLKFSSELLKCDEALYCMDRYDLEGAHEQQKKAFGLKCEAEAYVAAYARKKREFRPVAPGKGKGKKGRGVAAAAGKPLPLAFAQHEVKDYMPVGPGYSCWRGVVRAEWWAHLPPNKRIVVPLEKHHDDERTCIIAMLQKAWQQHNIHEGLAEKTCLEFPQLFDLALDSSDEDQ